MVNLELSMVNDNVTKSSILRAAPLGEPDLPFSISKTFYPHGLLRFLFHASYVSRHQNGRGDRI